MTASFDEELLSRLANVERWLTQFATSGVGEAMSAVAQARSRIEAARNADLERGEEKPVGKYDEVLVPFMRMMEAELHANSGKGDRPGWLAMSREELLLEIYYHLAKMQKATLKDDAAGIREFGADVANMAMMLVDKCGLLPLHPTPVIPDSSSGEAVSGGLDEEYWDRLKRGEHLTDDFLAAARPAPPPASEGEDGR